MFHGWVVRDPYRWMENDETRLGWWLDEQVKYGTRLLEGLPRRAAFLALIAKHTAPVARIGNIEWSPSALYIRALGPNSATWSLYRVDDTKGPVLVFDPAVHTSSRSSTLDYMKPSPDGRFIVLGISEDGSEDSELRILETASNRLLPDRIPHTQYADPHWMPDSRSFFYWKMTPVVSPLCQDTRALGIRVVRANELA
jgi:prolyl oligopeptidase